MVKAIFKSLLKGVLIGILLGALLWLISWNWVFTLSAGIFAVAITMLSALILAVLFKCKHQAWLFLSVFALLIVGYLIGIFVRFDTIYICQDNWVQVFVNTFGGISILCGIVIIWLILRGLFLHLAEKSSRRHTVWLCCQWLLSIAIGIVFLMLVK